MIAQYHSLLVDDPSRCVGTTTGAPRSSLRPYVLGYAGFRAEGRRDVRRRLLPVNLTTVIIDVDGMNVSRRALELRFQRNIGQSPKVVARIARFHRAVYELSRPGAKLAMATAYGYADQSHLSREVRALSGLAPTELFAFVQDNDGNAG